MGLPARSWIGALWRVVFAALLLAAGSPGYADEAQRAQRAAAIRALQEQHHALPDSAALVDALVDFLARRAFHSLAASDSQWNARNPRWQTLFTQFRLEFGEAVARMVPAYELNATMDAGRSLNKVLASFSAEQLGEIETALGEPPVLQAVASAQQAAPLAMRMMSANLLPQLYSEQELRAMALEAETKFGVDPASPEARKVVERLEQPTLKSYRERVMAALIDGSALLARLDSPALRADFDALTQRWRSSVDER